jgi:hypothetical protein
MEKLLFSEDFILTKSLSLGWQGLLYTWAATSGVTYAFARGLMR